MNSSLRSMIPVLIIILFTLWISGCMPQSGTTIPAPMTLQATETLISESETPAAEVTEIRIDPSATATQPTQTPTQTMIPPTSTVSLPTITATFTAPEVQHGDGIAFVGSGQNFGDFRSWDVDIGDLDGDGDLDVIVANSTSSQILFNDGRAIFSDSGQRLGSIFGLRLGDLDQDKDLDAITVDDQRGMAVWLNDGSGFFSKGQSMPSVTGNDVVLGDVDGDGDLDVYIARNGMNKLWLNDGQGEFTDSEQRYGGSNQVDNTSIKAELADLDGDGDLDVFEVVYHGIHRVWFNDGMGTFTNSGQEIVVGDNSHGVALGDLDGDGDQDVFVTVTNRMAFQVWFNDGKGIFNNSGQSLPSSNAQSVALGDLDGDGDLDAFMVNTGNSDAGESNTVWLNGGDGHFKDSGLRLGGQYSLAIVLGDLDGDGDLDAFVANSNFSDPAVDKSNRVWLNVSEVSE